MAGTFELRRTVDGQFMFNLKASNGQVILTSERYQELRKAQAGVESVRTNAANAARFETRTASDGKPYFVLKAANAQEIGRSQYYASAATCTKGIASVQANAADAKVADLTAEEPLAKQSKAKKKT